MAFSTAAVLFTLAVLLHNLEEAIWLPEWLQRHPAPFAASDPPAFRLALVVLSVLFVLLCLWGLSGSLLAGQVIGGAAAAMALNAVVPHLAVSLWKRSPMPGTASGLFLVLPAAWFALCAGFRDGRFAMPGFLVWIALVPLGLLMLVPILLWFGRMIR